MDLVLFEDAMKHVGENFVELMERQQREGVDLSGRKKQPYAADRLKAVQVTIQQLVEHEAFTAGAALHNFEYGFWPEHVRSDLSLQKVTAELKDVFAHMARL